MTGFVERTVRTLHDGLERTRTAERGAARRGLLQRLDPRVKLVGLVALVVCVTFARHAGVMLAILGLALVLAALSSAAVLRPVVRTWVAVGLFTIAIATPALFLTPGSAAWHVPWLGWIVTAQGVRAASYLVLRASTSAALAGLLVFTTSWPHVLKALRVFRVPAVFGVVLGMTYRYVVLLLETARDMFLSHRSRAAGPLPRELRRHLAVNTAGVLLTKTFQLSDDVYLAMQARGFSGDVQVLDEFRMKGADWLALALVAVCAGAAAWAGR